MRVQTGDRTYPEVPAKAEPADDVLTGGYYTLLPQIRLPSNAARDVETLLPRMPLLAHLQGRRK